MSTDLLTIESTVAYRAPTSRPVKAEEVEHDEAGSTTTLGFWIYLMSDCLLFAALFATYSVLAHETAGGPKGGCSTGILSCSRPMFPVFSRWVT